MKNSKVEFYDRFSQVTQLKSGLLLYDSYFDQTNDPRLIPTKAWINSFPHRLSLKAGESLKDLVQLPFLVEKILALVSDIPAKDLKLISFGGGSVGDFTGFLASILKRGVPLIHIPTTWLAAMDSSHGGKTALNVSGFKNQVGTFYPAEKIILIKPVLLSQPDERALDAFGEAIKMGLLQGGSLWLKLSKTKIFSGTTIWKLLPALIAAKYRIIKKDPYEKKGVRQLLNLGHTYGHVLELAGGLSHGTAVAYGIRAALEFSLAEGFLSKKQFEKLLASPGISRLPSRQEIAALIQKVNIDVTQALLKDKKTTTAGRLRFIFIRSPGRCEVQDVPINKLVAFYDLLGIE